MGGYSRKVSPHYSTKQFRQVDSDTGNVMESVKIESVPVGPSALDRCRRPRTVQRFQTCFTTNQFDPTRKKARLHIPEKGHENFQHLWSSNMMTNFKEGYPSTRRSSTKKIFKLSFTPFCPSLELSSYDWAYVIGYVISWGAYVIAYVIGYVFRNLSFQGDEEFRISGSCDTLIRCFS